MNDKEAWNEISTEVADSLRSLGRKMDELSERFNKIVLKVELGRQESATASDQWAVVLESMKGIGRNDERLRTAELKIKELAIKVVIYGALTGAVLVAVVIRVVTDSIGGP